MQICHDKAFARLEYPGGVCPNKQTGVSIPRQSEKWRAKVYETWLIGNLGRAGVSELGQIAGAGMLVAYITSITVLPALLYVLHPPGEQDALGIAALAANSQWLNCAAGNTVAAPAIWPSSYTPARPSCRLATSRRLWLSTFRSAGGYLLFVYSDRLGIRA
jgi:hypothetical protein